jgi:kynurenine formamidase
LVQYLLLAEEMAGRAVVRRLAALAVLAEGRRLMALPLLIQEALALVVRVMQVVEIMDLMQALTE